MTEFVIEKTENFDSEIALDEIYDYAKLLSTPLTLGMFIPCDCDGNVLEEPKPEMEIKKGHLRKNIYYNLQIQEYQKALSNVLFDVKHKFDGSHFFGNHNENYMVEYNPNTKKFYFGINIIEDLIPYKLNLKKTIEESK